MLSLLSQSARLHNCVINLLPSDHQVFQHQNEQKTLFLDDEVVSATCMYWD